MMERDGQLIDGVADLVIETDQEIILIDYKTFSGDAAQMQWKATTFSGQLKLYMDILQQGFSGKKVRGGIYFVMKGVVVWMGGNGWVNEYLHLGICRIMNIKTRMPF
ncbi:MAG: PD-(D/E)XK nuclease family protein [Saprospiraceae bacterium]